MHVLSSQCVGRWPCRHHAHAWFGARPRAAWDTSGPSNTVAAGGGDWLHLEVELDLRQVRAVSLLPGREHSPLPWGGPRNRRGEEPREPPSCGGTETLLHLHWVSFLLRDTPGAEPGRRLRMRLPGGVAQPRTRPAVPFRSRGRTSHVPSALDGPSRAGSPAAPPRAPPPPQSRRVLTSSNCPSPVP